MRISGIQGTELFTGTVRRPLQIVLVIITNDSPRTIGGHAAPVRIRIEGAAVGTPVPVDLAVTAPGAEQSAEVGVSIAAPSRPGTPYQITAVAEGEHERSEQAGQIRSAEPGWTMWMVSHFHYDPVWWDTQGEFTESRILLPGDDGELPDVRTAFDLVRLHLEHARADPDYKFVLAEVDYLKPYFDTRPEDREHLARLMAEGRIEIVGGNYNEPNTNLTSAESTIRNLVYGLGQQREVAGGDPRSAWMLDSFGHDPGYPGLMAAGGLTSSAWARGPYHQWGPERTVGDNTRMQMRSEFEWVSPDGAALLTAYMPSHYGAGWGTHGAADLAAAEREALTQFRALAPVAATRNVLLPVGADHVIPSRWVTAIHRDWNARYVWPRFVTALPAEFFAAVRHDAKSRGTWLVPQTRDMNPLYPGKDVSYIDTKQAQRAAEIAVEDGERLATLAWLAGAPYPAESLDKAWRQLVYGAHHDAITGTESDQVYLDLLGGWREAWERGEAAGREAAQYLAQLADTTVPAPLRASAGPVTNGPDPVNAESTRNPSEPIGNAGPNMTPSAINVFNTLSWPRSGLVTSALEFAAPGPPHVTVRDRSSAEVAALAEGVQRHPDGTLAAISLTFRAADVPAMGYRTYWACPGPRPAEATAGSWEPQPGTVIENDAFLVQADPGRGGTLTSIVDKRSGGGGGRELLRPGPGSTGANELVLQEEYDSHPRWGEGPWLLSPKGTATGSAAVSAKVTAQRCPLGSRLVTELTLGDLRVTQETLLWDGADRLEFRTHLDGSIGSDRLLRVRFPVSVPGGLPVYQAATAVVGRPFGAIDADVAEHPYTLDNPAHEWFGIGSTARVATGGAAGPRREHALGVAEVILPPPVAGSGADDPPGARDSLPAALREAITGLVAGLAGQGVTATCSWPDGPRYGSIDLDSNLPDFRLALGGPDSNPWTAALLADAGEAAAEELVRQLGATGSARLWLGATQTREQAFAPGADVRGLRDLPVLVIAGEDLAGGIRSATAELAGSVVRAVEAAPGAPPAPPLAGHSVALLNRGTPSSLVSPDGTLHIALMRSCSAWPAGVWIDGDRCSAPDGSSFAWQHWSHTFEYALAAGPGDWREAGFAVAGQEYNRPLLACTGGIHPGVLGADASLCSVEAPGGAAVLAALKPRGNSLAAGRDGQPRRADGVTVRLRDAGGRSPLTARLRLFTGIEHARLTGIAEDSDGAAVALRGGAAAVTVAPASTVTLAVGLPPGPATARLGGAWPALTEPEAHVPTSAPAGAGGSALPEPAQPVFTRYWLHGKGPAPAGNLPVAVHLSPRRHALSARDRARFRLTVAAGLEPASGVIELDVPEGLTTQPAGPLRYALGSRAHAEWDLTVTAGPALAAGHYFVAARISDSLGQSLEDAAALSVGGPPTPRLDQPPDDVVRAVEEDLRAIAAEVDVRVLTPVLHASPGGTAELAVRLENKAASPIRGEAQLLSPFGSWAAIRPWTRGFAVFPGKQVTLRYHVQVPVHVRRGTQWWAVVKLMYFGRLHYVGSVPVVIPE